MAIGISDADKNYPINFFEEDGRYCLRIDEMGLIVWGDTFEAAYRELIARKQQVLEQAREAGMLDQSSLLRHKGEKASDGSPQVSSRSTAGPLSSTPQPQMWSQRPRTRILLPVCVTLAVCIPIGIGLAILGNDIETAAAELRNEVPRGRVFWDSLENAINSAAQSHNEIDPEREAKLLASLRILVARAKPFIDALAPLAAGDGAAGTASTAKAGLPSGAPDRPPH